MTYLTEQLARMREQIRNLSRDKVTYREAEVTAVDTVGNTFTAVVPDTAPLAGISAPPQFMPEVGDTVRLSLYGATAIYEPGSIAEGAITTRELDDTINADIDEASANATVALEAANGKNAVVFATTTPTVSGGTVGDIWWQRSGTIIVGAWEWDGDSWESRTFGDAVFDTISAGRITTGTLGVGVTIYVGDPAGDHTRLSADGLVAYADDPVDGVSNEVARFGRTSGTTSPITGLRTWTGDEEGNHALHSLATDLLTVGGQDVLEVLNTYARGTKVWFGDGRLQSNIAAEFGVAEAVFTADPNRNYTVSFGGGFSSTENDGEYTVLVHWTTDGSRPTFSSPILARRTQTHRVGGRWMDWEWTQFFQRGTTDLNIHLLLTIARGAGQATGTVSTPGTAPFLRVEDKGVSRASVGTNQNDGTTVGPAPVALQTYDQPASWSRSFKGDGTIRTDTTDMVQGYYSVNGDGKAMFGWPSLTTTLSGATIQSVEVFVQNYLWYYTAGGTLILGTHSQTAAPASFSGTSNRKTVAFGPAPSGKWIDVTAWASEIAAGTTRGFVLGPSGGTNRTYYGRFAGALDPNTAVRPRLRIVYYK